MKKLGIYVSSILLTLVLVMSILFSGPLKTNAEEKRGNKDRIYESIKINAGDSLWSIAEEYKPDYESTEDYIDVIKQVNQLHTDNIHAGNSLIVYHYVEE